MKVLIICETMAFGVGRNVRDVISGLLDRDCLVSLTWSRERASEEFIRWIESNSHANFSHYELAMKRSPCWSDIGVVFDVIKLIRQSNGFDIIHGMSSKGGAVARIVALLTGSKAYYSPHAFILSDPSLSKLKYFFYYIVERVLSLKTGVVCTSSDEISVALDLGVKKRSYIPNGIDLRCKYNKSNSNEFAISFIGRLCHQKNPHRFIEIANRLSYLPIKFNVFGDGVLMQSAKDAVTDMLEPKIKFWGVEGLETIWENTSFLIGTSLYEGCPYIFLDAMNQGVPIATTPVGGVDAVITDSKIGVVLNDDQAVIALEKYLKRLLEEPEYLSLCQQACRENAVRFSHLDMVDGLLKFYNR